MKYKVGSLVVTPNDTGWFYTRVDHSDIIAEVERLLKDTTVKKISITKIETINN